jgi:hypothetical protein
MFIHASQVMKAKTIACTFGDVSSNPLQPLKFMTTGRQPRACAAAHIHLQ